MNHSKYMSIKEYCLITSNKLFDMFVEHVRKNVDADDVTESFAKHLEILGIDARPTPADLTAARIKLSDEQTIPETFIKIEIFEPTDIIKVTYNLYAPDFPVIYYLVISQNRRINTVTLYETRNFFTDMGRVYREDPIKLGDFAYGATRKQIDKHLGNTSLGIKFLEKITFEQFCRERKENEEKLQQEYSLF